MGPIALRSPNVSSDLVMAGDLAMPNVLPTNGADGQEGDEPMEGYCAQCHRWFEIDHPELDAGFLCPNCLTHASVVRAKKRVAHGRRRTYTIPREPIAPSRTSDTR